MRTTIDLPDELVRQAKILAVQRGSTLRDLVAAGLRHEIMVSGVPAPMFATLPSIRLKADAPVLRMTPADINAALHHEDALDDSGHTS